MSCRKRLRGVTLRDLAVGCSEIPYLLSQGS